MIQTAGYFTPNRTVRLLSRAALGKSKVGEFLFRGPKCSSESTTTNHGLFSCQEVTVNDAAITNGDTHLSASSFSLSRPRSAPPPPPLPPSPSSPLSSPSLLSPPVDRWARPLLPQPTVGSCGVVGVPDGRRIEGLKVDAIGENQDKIRTISVYRSPQQCAESSMH